VLALLDFPELLLQTQPLLWLHVSITGNTLRVKRSHIRTVSRSLNASAFLSEVLRGNKENVMQNTLLSGKMPIIDTLKTAGVIGLLMQQTAAIPTNRDGASAFADEVVVVGCCESDMQPVESVEDALQYIKVLTGRLRESYRIIAQADHEKALEMIASLGAIKPEVLEHQLKGVEGLAKIAFQSADIDRKPEIKNIVLIVAKARSAVSDLNHLVTQMTAPVSVYESSIDRDGLGALARHGTTVFYSDKFH
jgi:hypothetical protein